MESGIELVDEKDNITLLNLKSRLQLCLDQAKIRRPGCLHWQQPLGYAPNPGLYVDGFGTIGLPLSERDVEGIKASGNVAQKTFWEVPGALCELRNPAWEEYVASLVAEAGSKMGVLVEEKGIAASLNSLVLYEGSEDGEKQLV